MTLKDYAEAVARARLAADSGEISWAEYRSRVERAQSAYYDTVRQEYERQQPEPFPGSSDLEHPRYDIDRLPARLREGV